MYLNIYDRDIKRIGSIQSWVSLTWEEQYNGVGSLTLEVVQTNDMVELIKPWRYCTIDKSDSVMLILSVQIENGHIVAYGKSAACILERRISTAVISNANAEQSMLSLVSNMHPWEGIRAGEPTGISDVFESQTSGGTILDYFMTIAGSADIGFKVLKKGYGGFLEDDNEEPLITSKNESISIFEPSSPFTVICYKPSENRNARYSLGYGNLSGIKYTVSDMDRYNVALVAGAGEEDERVKVYAGAIDATGNDRLEMYIDARDLQQEEDETDEAYMARLVARGEKTLLDHLQINSIEFGIDEERASLGDIVSINLPEYGVSKKVRVTSRTITSEYNAESITLGVGESIL